MQATRRDTQSQKAPLVSFIVTYYELPIEMLFQCLNSIMALSLSSSDREIIIVDDGSRQSPLPHLGPYTDEVIYVRQPNGGLSEARNTGIRISKGTYIQFVDGDDQLIRSSYEHALDIVRYQSPDMVMFGFTNEPEALSVFDDTPLMSGTNYMRSYNLQGSACCYLFKKSALGELRFTAGIYHEDEEFTPLLLLRADSVISTNAKAYQYRKRENSIMSATNIRHLLKRLNDNKSIISRLNEMADTLPTESRIALLRRVHQLTMDYLYNIILLTRNRHYLDRRIAELHAIGLYPLPKRDYTRKYIWFRRLINTEIGISMLMRAIPLMKKER